MSGNSSADKGSDVEFLAVETDLSAVECRLFEAIGSNDVAGVQQAIRNNANVNCIRHVDDDKNNDATPLFKACHHRHDEIVRILLDAGADARWRDSKGWSTLHAACWVGQSHLPIVEMLLNHDKDLLEFADDKGWTPLFWAIRHNYEDIIFFLMDRGANVHSVDKEGITPLMLSARFGPIKILRRLLAAGADVEARDDIQRTALHYASWWSRGEVAGELAVEHNANMFVVDNDGKTPFDCAWQRAKRPFLGIYAHILTQMHGRAALHAILAVADYSFAIDDKHHPPLNLPLQIILPLGKLTLQHFRSLLRNLHTEILRNRDNSGTLPIHVACRNNAPVEVLASILEHDVTTLHYADTSTGSLPLHECCRGAVAHSTVRYILKHSGVGTLTARNHQGELPLHLLCGSTNPPLRTVRYMIRSFPGSVAARTNAGHYPFMIAACESSNASLSVVYKLVRANPNLLLFNS